MLGILGQDQKNSRRGLLEIKLSDFGHSKLINDGYSTALTRDAWTARMTHCWGCNGETSETKMKLLLDHARYFLIMPNTRLFIGQWLRVGSVKINAFDAFFFKDLRKFRNNGNIFMMRKYNPIVSIPFTSNLKSFSACCYHLWAKAIRQ